MLNCFLFQLLFVALTIGSASGQCGEASWVKLGEIDVAPGAASSRVDLAAVNGRSSAVQLRMARGGLTLSRISVEYSNGQVFTDTTERKLALKDHTKLIDARPEGRFIDGVEVGYPKAGVPVVVAGIDTIDASRVSNDFLSLNHSDFADGAPSTSGHRPHSEDRPSPAKASPCAVRGNRRTIGDLLEIPDPALNPLT